MVATRGQVIKTKVENARTRTGKARVRAESLQPRNPPTPPPPHRRIIKKKVTKQVVDHVLIPGPQDSMALRKTEAAGLVEQEDSASRAPQKNVVRPEPALPSSPAPAASLASPARARDDPAPLSSPGPAAFVPVTPAHKTVSPTPTRHSLEPHSSSPVNIPADEEEVLAKVPLPPYEPLYTEDTLSKLRELRDEAWAIDPEATNEVMDFFWCLGFPLDSEDRDGGLYSVDAESPELRRKVWEKDHVTVFRALRSSLRRIVLNQEFKGLVNSKEFSKVWAYYRGGAPEGYMVPSEVQPWLEARDRLRDEFDTNSTWVPRSSSPAQSSPSPRNFVREILPSIEETEELDAEDQVQEEEEEEEEEILKSNTHRRNNIVQDVESDGHGDQEELDAEVQEEEEGEGEEEEGEGEEEEGEGEEEVLKPSGRRRNNVVQDVESNRDGDHPNKIKSKQNYAFGPANVARAGQKRKVGTGSTAGSRDAARSSGAEENVGNAGDKQVAVAAGRVPGRIKKNDLSRAFAIFKRFQDEIDAFAGEIGKSSQTIYTAIGMNVVEDRELNSWNLHQMWTYSENGGGWKRGEEESVEEFEGKVKRAYERWKKKDTFEEELADMRAWYYDQVREDDIAGGGKDLTTRQLNRLTTRFTQRAAAINRTHGVVAFGYIVDPKHAKVVAYGAGRAYERMKIENASKIEAQSLDYGTMLHLEWMKDQEKTALPHEIYRITHVNCEDRKQVRPAFGEVMMLSLRKANPSTATLTMAYGTGFADLCFKNRVRLVNWDPSTPPLGTAEVYQLSKVAWTSLKGYMKKWVLYYKAMNRELKFKHKDRALYEDDSEDDVANDEEPDEEQLLRFEPWTTDEINLSYREQAEIPIVLSAPNSKYPHGEPLVRLKQSPQFRQQRENLKHLETDSEEDVPASTMKVQPTQTRLHRRREKVTTTEESDEEDEMAIESEEKRLKRKKSASRKAKGKKRGEAKNQRSEGTEIGAFSTETSVAPRPKPKPAGKRKTSDEEPPRKRRRVEDVVEGVSPDVETATSRMNKRKREETEESEADEGSYTKTKTKAKKGKKKDTAGEDPTGRKMAVLPKRMKKVVKENN